MADEGLCVGDHICLYSEELYNGYIYSSQSSGVHNELAIWSKGNRLKPDVPDPQVFTFEVCVANRYKLNKKCKVARDKASADPGNVRLQHIATQTKLAADAETEDNLAEQRRQRGKKVLYGQTIQLRHVFTKKYIHVSTTQTSQTETTNMQVSLLPDNAKHAHFRIMPRYKVKAEGDIVHVADQVVLESNKTAGQYLHVSKIPYTSQSVYCNRHQHGVPQNPEVPDVKASHELNLSVVQSGFTIYRRYKLSKDQETFLKSGDIVRLFHKEVEAYLVAEGLFDDQVTDDVHLRVRPVDQTKPKTMFPPTSAITYWQIELQDGPLSGGVVKWEQQCRIKHMTTRLYLKVESSGRCTLTNDYLDPTNIFRFHPVIKERDEMSYESYCRVEHAATGLWLHAHDQEFKRKDSDESGTADPFSSLKWTTAPLKQVAAVREMQYDDAFTLQEVDSESIAIFNYMAGMVPFIQKLIQEKEKNVSIHTKEAFQIVHALQELKSFMIVNSEPRKERQKLMRNLRIVELLIRLLKTYRGRSSITNTMETRIYVEAYDTLYTYLMGDSRKNELYIAKHIQFFQTQIEYSGEIGLNAAHMTMELVKDNRKIVDRISKPQINHFVELLKKNKNYRYLDLLSVLCVCDGVSIPDNQSYITKVWLMEGTNCVFYTDLGQKIGQKTNVVYVSTNNQTSWQTLADFSHEKLDANDEQFEFLEHQLDLFGQLCYGRNEFSIEVITNKLKYLSWEEAHICLTDPNLPDRLRAKYCHLVIGLFVDVGKNHDLLEHINLTFVYDDIGGKEKLSQRPLTARGASQQQIQKSSVTAKCFITLRDWIASFLDQNHDMTASLIGHNMLVEQVLRLIHYLVKYGFYDKTADINKLLSPLLDLLDGRNDKPYPKIKGADSRDVLEYYRTTGRFLPSPETKAIVDAKFRAMEVLDLFFNFRFNTRLEGFVAIFKKLYHKAQTSTSLDMGPLLQEDFDLEEHYSVMSPAKKALSQLFDESAVFKGYNLTDILMDLSRYQYPYMVTQSMKLLNRFFSSHENLFKRAVQAQVLLVDQSVHVLNSVQRDMPVLRRLATAKMNEEQTTRMISILERMIKLCSLEEGGEPHPMNQSVLYNHGIIEDIFNILSQDVDIRLLEQYKGLQQVFKLSFILLKVLARGNGVIQRRYFDRLDMLLDIQGAEPEMAEALTEVFTGNKNCCMKILPSKIQKIMSLAASHKTKAPQFLDLLNAVVKVEELDLPLKRNQSYVMKYFMQYRSDVATVIDQPPEQRTAILIGGKKEELTYFTSLVDMLATCAEGENRFIESICQTIFSINELLAIVNNASVLSINKRPFLRFLLWVYLNTASGMIESGAGDLPHDGNMWQFICSLSKEIATLTEFSKKSQDAMMRFLKEPPNRADTKTDLATFALHGSVHYLFDGILPFLQVFFRTYYQPDAAQYPDEAESVDQLAHSLVDLVEEIGSLICSQTHMKTMVGCVSSVLSASTLPVEVMDSFQSKYGNAATADAVKSEARKRYEDRYSGEEEVNEKLNLFAINCSVAYGGLNDVRTQIGHPSSEEYTEIGGDEELPLGQEFQDLIKCFISTNESLVADMYVQSGTLLQQLSISNHRVNLTEKEKLEQENLDIKCLKILRGMVHNEIIKLPRDWQNDLKANEGQLEKVAQVISAMNGQGGVVDVLPHLAKTSDDLIRELLAFLVAMLFAGHLEVQDSLIDYFLNTREEVFFFAIKNRMNLSALAAKERRSLMAQHQAKVDVAIAQAKALNRAMMHGQLATQQITGKSMLGSIFTGVKGSVGGLGSKKKMSNSAKLKARMGSNRMGSHRTLQDSQLLPITEHLPQHPMLAPSTAALMAPQKSAMTSQALFPDIKVNGASQAGSMVMDLLSRGSGAFGKSKKSALNIVAPKPNTIEEIDEAELEALASAAMAETEDLEYEDDGYIELVLRLLAGMCDGQNETIQDYIREQPDNIKSVNLVSETTKFLSIVYSNINSSSIPLVTELFSTLIEFVQGNAHNQAVVFDNKVCDFINHILRSVTFKGCSKQQVYEMKISIGTLVMAMVEANRRENKETTTKDFDASAVSLKQSDVMESLDEDSIYQVSVKSYQDIMAFGLMKGDREAQELKDLAIKTGFLYFHVLMRMFDLDSNSVLHKSKILKTPLDVMAWNYYTNSTLSVEIVKNDSLQKLYFRVEDKNVLREEIKENFKYSVDRSSPMDKIRDFMSWSHDIICDIYYQKGIMANPIARFFVSFWLWFNYGAVLLSFMISVLILVTWRAPTDAAGKYIIQKSATVPTSDMVGWDIMTYILGGLHNLLSLCVLISYFLSNKPTLPKWLVKSERRQVHFLSAEDEGSHLEVKLFSFKTLYYIMFLAFSILGTVFYGYFFAFHLLHIAALNQLLSRVIMAVTKNENCTEKTSTSDGRYRFIRGLSLVMVAILGLALSFIYSLISFAYLRELYLPANGLYCTRMYECFVTLIHQGFIENTRNYLYTNTYEGKDFNYHLALAVYDVTFFILITTIGLNIIFGIIVDTFSELRDSKWQVDNDMSSTCFICSRSSYDFDQHARGFQEHVKSEHHQWSYLFFFMHLNATRTNDYTANELYVYRQLLKRNYDFFPLHRALSLRDEESATDAKIETVLNHMEYVVENLKSAEMRKDRELERKRQMEWEESIKSKKVARAPPSPHLPFQ